jgi:tetratricopeptide (TPR) repeat protein
MNQTHKIITQLVCAAGAVFLTVAFCLWTVFPYSQMWIFFNNMQKGIAGDSESLLQSHYSFYPMTSIQPMMRYYFLDFILQIYAHQADEGQKKFAEQTLPFAIDRMVEGASDKPNYAQFFLTLGTAYDLMANLHPDQAQAFHLKAIEQFKKSLELYPGNQRTLYAYAISLADQGKVDDALAMMRQMTAYDSRLQETSYYFGLLLYMKDNYANSDTALDHIDHALAKGINPTPELTKKVYEKMFAYYYQKGDLEHFKIVAERLSSMDENQAAVYKQIVDYINANNTIPLINLK